MALDSNAIWAALAQRIADNASGFNRVSRKRRDWGLEEHPVCMVLDDSGDEVLLSDSDDPAPVWSLAGEIVILARAKDTDEAPVAPLNDLKRSVIEALERRPTDPIGNGLSHYTDLGGLIRVLSVARVEKGAGALTGQAIARISVTMETNPP